MKKTGVILLIEQVILSIKTGINQVRRQEINWELIHERFIHFMKDEDGDESSDLKFPSEEKGEKEEGSKLGRWAREKGEQLVLFFKKKSKKAILVSLLFIEDVIKQLEGVFFRDAVEFENRFKED